jgi:hypothetical protein
VAALGVSLCALVWTGVRDLRGGRQPRRGALLLIFAVYLVSYFSLSALNIGVWVLGKHMATCLPAFVGWALIARRRGVFEAMLVVFATLMTLMGLFSGMEQRFTWA